MASAAAQPDSSHIPAGTLQPAPISFPEDPITSSHEDIVQCIPPNGHGSMANIFLQPAWLSYKAAQAVRTPGAAPAACLHYNCFAFPSGMKSDNAEYYISLGYPRHNVKQPRVRARGDGAGKAPPAAPHGQHRGSFSVMKEKLKKLFLVLLKSKPSMFGVVGPIGPAALTAEGEGTRRDRGWRGENGENASATYRGGESRRHLPNLFGLSIWFKEKKKRCNF